METQTENTNTENQEQQYIPLHKSYCRECGTMISAKAITCPKCGATQNSQTEVRQDEAAAGWKVLSFFIPLAGLILYIIQHKTSPKMAKACGKWALIGFITGISLIIIYYIVVILWVITMMAHWNY